MVYSKSRVVSDVGGGGGGVGERKRLLAKGSDNYDPRLRIATKSTSSSTTETTVFPRRFMCSTITHCLRPPCLAVAQGPPIDQQPFPRPITSPRHAPPHMAQIATSWSSTAFTPFSSGYEKAHAILRCLVRFQNDLQRQESLALSQVDGPIDSV